MAEQYLRKCKVIVEGANKQLDMSELRIRFDTHQFTAGTPHHANIYLYNLSRTTAESVRKEYGKITLEAGYQSGSGIIFMGEILQVRTYRENVTDTVTHVLATTSQKARNFAVVNTALAAGHTHDERVKAALKAFAEHGVTKGHIDSLGSMKFPRGFAFSGMATDLLRQVCFAREASWFITNGKLNVLKNSDTLPGNVIVLSSTTGLIGIPEQTLQGVIVRCLLNFRLLPGQKLKIDEKSITRAAINPATAAGGQNKLLNDDNILGLAADGVYKALLVEHNGDTRGPNWYTEIICVKADGGESPALKAQGISDDFSVSPGAFNNPSIKAGPR